MDINWLEWLALVVAALVAVYLAYTLVRGERL